jgi:catecholate siderophore receptor
MKARSVSKRELRSRNIAGTKSWPVTYRWLAVGTVAIYSAIGNRVVDVARAQSLPQTVGPRSAARAASQEFHIEPGMLRSVLQSFQDATHLQVMAADPGLLDVASPGVSGLWRPAQALEQILNDTRITYRFTSPEHVLLELTKVVTSVEVTTSIDALATSTPKYAAPLEDTPQTISLVSHNVIEQQNATTLRDTLRNVAGISLAAGEGGAQGDNLTIRGFTARNDLFIDGMRDFGSYYRDPFNTEEVEVLQGPSSVMFGRGSTGGVVNQATKTPMLSHSISGEVDGGTDATRRTTLDINRPLPELGSGTAFRLNLMGDEGNIAGRDIAENRRFGIAPSLAFGLGTPTRVTLSYFHQTGDDIPDYGIPWLLNGPAPVNRNNYYGFTKDSNYLRTYDDIGTVRAEHDFGKHFTLRNQTRYANYLRRAQITEPQLLAPASGSITAATPLSAIGITRNEITVNSVEEFLEDQLDVSAKVETGFLKHSIVTGVEMGHEISDPTRPKFTNVPATRLLNPDPAQTFSGTETISSDVHTMSKTAGVYALDTVQLGRKWQVMGGIRWDRFNTHYTQNIAPAAAFKRLDEMRTWRAGVVYKPVAFASFYASAGTSFNPSAESLSLSAANANLPPEKNRTIEAGTKWDLRGSRVAITAAVFRTDKTDAREPDPTNSLLNVLAGNQRVNGTQVGISGHVTRRWEILSSYAYLDAKVVSSNFYPAAVGARLANVAANTFNFWNEYRLPAGWDVGAGANFVGSRTASSTAPLDPVTGVVKQVPGYWVFNAMAEHRLNEHVRLQGNLYNIANRYYYDQLHPAHIILGPGRSALIGLKFNF